MGAKRFEGRHVLVSGGAAGVGGEVSRLFAAEGAKVTIVDILGQVGRDLTAELTRSGAPALMIESDVSSEEAVTGAVRQAAERFGPVDVLHNHAGTTIVKPFHETTTAEWKRLFDINVHSMFFMTRAVIPGMLKKGKGVIVNTSSVSAILATPMEVAYCSTKGACHVFTKAIATEYRDQNIRCNAVCPGFVRTPHGLREVDALNKLGVDMSDAALAVQQGRICEPEEVACAALFLASDEASFVNGAHLFVDNCFTAV